jgi:hypothetical protein
MSFEEPPKTATSQLDAEAKTPQNLSKSESEQEFQRIHIERERMEFGNELLRKGLDNGKNAVYLAFFTFGVVFIMSFLEHYARDKTFWSPQQLLWLTGMMCLTLIIYFGFIFGYSVYLKADFEKRQLNAGSKKES